MLSEDSNNIDNKKRSIYYDNQTIQIDCLDVKIIPKTHHKIIKKSSTNECSQKYIAFIPEISVSNYFFLADFTNNSPPINTWVLSYSMKVFYSFD